MRIRDEQSGQERIVREIGSRCGRRLLPRVLLFSCCAVVMLLPSVWGYVPYPVVFVGNSVVDLKWSAGSCYEYRILRDGVVVGTLSCEAEPWFRDPGVVSGATHAYLVSYRAANGTELRSAGPATVTAGNVEGRLYQSLSFDTGTYAFTGTVYVHQGAGLTVGPGVTLQSAEGAYSAGIESAGNSQGQYEYPGGPVSMNGATVDGLRIVYSAASENVCSGNNFTDSTVIARGSGSLTVNGNNVFQDSSIGVLDSTQATITGNEFQGLSFIRTGGAGTQTTISQNRFFTGARSGYDSTIWVSEGSADITQNLLEGQGDAHTIGEGILVGLVDASPPNVTITGNIIRDFAEGITVNDDHGQVTVTGNTLTGNGTAINAYGTTTVTVHNNCIAGNDNTGLYVGPQQSVDAVDNWWGSDTGPRNPVNPSGTGDYVIGDGTVTFDPWLLADNCMTEIPGPPGPKGNTPAIWLAPTDYPDFQVSVLRKNGFDLFVRDEDGLTEVDGTWKIDWLTLRLHVDGNDRTDQFFGNIIAEVTAYTDLTKVPVGAYVSEDGKQLRLHFDPDPLKFMTTHNLFGILRNGDVLIQFRICDTDGNCGASDARIYFGPMVFLGGPVEAVTDGGGGIVVKNLSLAYLGVDNFATALFWVIQNLQSGVFKSFTDDKKGDGQEWRVGIFPEEVYGNISSTQGRYIEIPESYFIFDGLTQADQNVPLRFYVGLLDMISGAMRIDWVDFTIPGSVYLPP